MEEEDLQGRVHRVNVYLGWQRGGDVLTERMHFIDACTLCWSSQTFTRQEAYNLLFRTKNARMNCNVQVV